MTAILPAICVLVAGAVRASLPGDAFTVAWTHSVQRSQWEERYRVVPGGLLLEEARVQGSGAGMEPGPDAVRRGGWWIWAPHIRLPAVILTASHFTDDYTVCTAAGCAPLARITGAMDDGTAITIAPCGAASGAAGSRHSPTPPR